MSGMTQKYLLPCGCGSKLEVDRSQCGLTLVCTCGAQLVVPTLRGLQDLEPAAAGDAPSPTAPRRWSRGQGLIFLGCVLLLASGVGEGALWLMRPKPPRFEWSHEENLKELDARRLTQLWDLWDLLRKGLEEGGEFEPVTQYRQQLAKHQVFVWTLVLPAALGVLLLLAGLVLPSGASRRKR
ncbi:MAG: hypothetical protein K6T86_17015 [Pirellulales bacterium]|nr:hypothetical protein [Pirellulales bacterium]